MSHHRYVLDVVILVDAENHLFEHPLADASNVLRMKHSRDLFEHPFADASNVLRTKHSRDLFEHPLADASNVLRTKHSRDEGVGCFGVYI